MKPVGLGESGHSREEEIVIREKMKKNRKVGEAVFIVIVSWWFD